MIDKIGILTSTRGRPQNIGRFIKSWQDTTAGCSDLILLLDTDDPTLTEYYKNVGVIFSVNPRKNNHRGAAQIFQTGYTLFPDYKYYFFGSDDLVFITKNWDKIMIDKIVSEGGVAIPHANDLFQKGNLVACPLIPLNLLKAVGYFSPSKFVHCFVDNIWTDIGKAINKLFFMPDVIIEHLHPYAQKALMDTTYSEVNSGFIFANDKYNYIAWKNEELPKIIERIKKIIPF